MFNIIHKNHLLSNVLHLTSTDELKTVLVEVGPARFEAVESRVAVPGGRPAIVLINAFQMVSEMFIKKILNVEQFR